MRAHIDEANDNDQRGRKACHPGQVALTGPCYLSPVRRPPARLASANRYLKRGRLTLHRSAV